MKNDTSATYSVWMEEPSIPDDGPLSKDVTADVCIVGAGISGLTTAYLLSKEGKRVVVLDDGEIGGTMTSRTTAHVVNALDDRYFELEKLHGEDGARIAAESHTAAIDTVERIVNEESIDCEFERLDGYLFVPPGESDKCLGEELDACHRLGLMEVEWADRAPIEAFDTGRCLRFPRQAQFHPIKYVKGLARAIREGGGKLYSGTHASKIEGGEPGSVETGRGAVVTAGAVVVATNTPVNDRVVMHTKQGPYVTYVIGLKVPKGRVAKALFWDTPDPYHYVRLTNDPKDPNSEILIVGGEDHKTGQADDTEERFGRLEEWTRERFPSAGETAYRWSGQVMEPVDGMGYIGRNPWDEDNVYIVTGDSGNGMTHGTLAGILLTDLIMGRENAWEKLYDPSRTPLRDVTEFVKENVNVAAQYTDLVTGGDVSSVDEIAVGEGAVIRDGLTKLAVYRDETGSVLKMSAICPHLGCVVKWNTTEKSWDCPCHGSRYDRFGKVFQGPANSDLPPAE
jgi:glycine/D-amino acid oxidase-like deaminating enzyme/nitrite reductase/ring-hydroxylating ferredoxin subunit